MFNLLRYLLGSFLWTYQTSHMPPYHKGLVGGRRIDWQPYTCLECGYTAPFRWFVHSYYGYGFEEDETEYIDECPKCGSEDIEPTERVTVTK